jgi:muramidase (phage lysozyme)
LFSKTILGNELSAEMERNLLDTFRKTPAGRQLLDTISYAEGTRRADPAESYRVMYGGGTFDDLSQHPDKVIQGGRYSSAAAGRYQFMPNTWGNVSKRLELGDFGAQAQDLAALKLARDRLLPIGGLATVEKEGFSSRVSNALSPEWASLPTTQGVSYYGQPVKSLEELQKVYGQAPAPTTPEPAPVPPEVAPTPASSPSLSMLKNFIKKRLPFIGANSGFDAQKALKAAFSPTKLME